MHSVGTGWMWLGFFIFVLFVFVIDMFILGGKKSHRMSLRESLSWTLVWVTCAIIFGVFLRIYLERIQGAAIAHQKALEFFTGYIIEFSLSVDNLFVFILIFSYFHVPEQYQRRVLLYGVLGAIVMRLIMIFSGTWLVSQFHWVLYLFGIFLIYTGIKMFFMGENKKDLSQNPVLVFIKKHLRVTHDYHAEKFFIRKNLLWYATPLFLVLVMIELSDLIFALDSIPAILAITYDPFIVFTSNIFAIMGLRALYFLLAYMADRFYLLKYGIALVLIFIGAKMLVMHWIELPIVFTLGIVAAVLATTVVLSLLVKKE